MPSSAQTTITPMITEILKIKPKRILDIGIGFGKWGFLCREYLETWADKPYRHQWTTHIDGIEIWKPYIINFDWIRIFYNNIFEGDASKLIKYVEDYDLIIAGDMIEHLEKERGEEFIVDCIKKSRYFIASIPLGDKWGNNPLIDGNPYEAHLSVWEQQDLERIAKEQDRKIKIIIWEGSGRRQGCLAIFSKE